MIDVILADDQQLLIDLLTIGLQQSDDICVVATANNGREAIELAIKHHPDVILMDIMMPECDGIKATKEIKAIDKSIKILVLTNGDKGTDLQKAMEAGADGYVLKNISQQDLLLAVRGVCANMKIVTKNNDDESYAQLFSKNNLHNYKKQVMINDELLNVSQRELTLIQMVVESMEIAEMATILELSEGSVRNLISGLITKFQVKDRTQLAVFALKNQLVEAY